jgi:hypothetical protein
MFLLCSMERVLTLVRKLIDYAKELTSTVKQRVAADPVFARRAFGTNDLTVIFATIARGVTLAFALEARLVERVRHAERQPRPAKAPSPRKPRTARPLAPPATEADPALTRLPTPQQIAAEVRRRPIGAVIVDICRDLGIIPSHPLWREAQELIIQYGGNHVRLVMAVLDRVCPLPARTVLRAALAVPPVPTPAGTGPP